MHNVNRMNRPFYLLSAGVLLTSLISSCSSWRDFGCTTGRMSGHVLATSFIDSYNEEAFKKHKPLLTRQEQADIISTAEDIGCILGSELAGAVEDYTNKQREAYRTEVAYLEAHISDMKKDIAQADKEIDYLNQQATMMAQQGRNLKKVPAMKSVLKGKLSESVAKRKSQAQKLRERLTNEKNDSQRALTTTSDAAKKAELKKQISELDKRITKARDAEKNILKAEHVVNYA